ncbi:MAG: hypothetical protein DRP02_02340 [Candidatus Gerdarchaeota archaeon]|nr:MAG: hypothetical protein DRP02_02340 [Candidatus Gerdarchaeota archaeon]
MPDTKKTASEKKGTKTLSPPQKKPKKEKKKMGRPKGSKSQATLSREEIGKAIKLRIAGMADMLIEKQLSLAKGIQYLMVTEKHVGPRGGDLGTTTRVEKSPQIIKDYFDGKIIDTEFRKFHFITTEKPDGRSCDSLLDRAFGKATQAVEIDGGLNINVSPELKKKANALLDKIL